MDPERNVAQRSDVEGMDPERSEVEGAWHVYILLCRDGAYYVGCTNDLPRRWQEHCTGRGGHYTRCNPPVRLLYSEQFPSRMTAETRERQLKGWTRVKKQALIAGNLRRLKEPYPDMEGSRSAMIRAARRAANAARQHQQPLVFWRDGRIVHVMPDDLPDLPEETPRSDKG